MFLRFLLAKKQSFLAQQLAAKKALMQARAEQLIERYENKAAELEDRADAVREKYQDRADAIRDHYQAKADALSARGCHHLAAKFQRIGELKASKIEEIGERKAMCLERAADKFQAKADCLKAKLGLDDVDEDDLDDDIDDVDDDIVDEDDDEDTTDVKFFIDTNGDGQPLFFVTLEAPEGFDPNNPDLDALREEVQAEIDAYEAQFPGSVPNNDPSEIVIQATILLPDGTAIDIPFPYAEDTTIEDLSTGNADDADYADNEDEDEDETLDG